MVSEDFLHDRREKARYLEAYGISVYNPVLQMETRVLISPAGGRCEEIESVNGARTMDGHCGVMHRHYRMQPQPKNKYDGRGWRSGERQSGAG